jgi:hypothetical protein
MPHPNGLNNDNKVCFVASSFMIHFLLVIIHEYINELHGTHLFVWCNANRKRSWSARRAAGGSKQKPQQYLKAAWRRRGLLEA